MPKKISRKKFLGLTMGSVAGMIAAPRALAAANQSNPITLENAKPGTANWQPTNQAQQREIEGYANRTSVAPGQSISFFVSTSSLNYTIEIYRLGWYGGDGGRLHRSSGSLKGKKQTIPTPNATTGLCECKWATPWTTSVPTGASAWVSGYYLAKLTTKEGKQSHIPFVVRDDSRFATYMVQASVTTWQAYNNWGGKSLYDYNSTNSKRAYKVSFNRPYNAYGSTDLYDPYAGWELNNLRFFEREGYDVKYVTNVDIHENPGLLYSANSFISSGHDEYWSMAMRDNVEYVPNEGIHLGFLGANAAYWQVRFEGGSSNGANRTLVCYKDAALDPNAQSTNTATRSTTTVKWRDVDQGGYTRPEAEMIGVQFVHYPVNTDMIVKNTDNFLFAGTGLVDGDRLTGMVGYEADEIAPSSPSNIIKLAETPVVTEYSSGFHHMTMYSHPGGALVFASGSHQWSWGLDNFFGGQVHPNLENPAVKQIMRNVMSAFSL